MQYVYRIYSACNNRSYIGITCDLRRRKREHFGDLKAGKHHNAHLQNAYNQYGSQAFTWYVVESINDDADIKSREKYWIAHFDSYANGYNLTQGGDEQPDANKTPCVWNEVQYSSVAEAARACDINLATMQERLAKGYTCDDDVRYCLREVEYNGVHYSSMKAAAEANGINYGTMKTRIYRGAVCDDDLIGYDQRGVLCEWNGITYPTISAAARALGINRPTLDGRLRKGYRSDTDIQTPESVMWNGVQYASIREAAEDLGINYSTMRSRVQRGFTCDDDVKNTQWKPQRLEIDGLVFESGLEAAKHFGVTTAAISYWVKHGRARKID